MKTIIIPDRYTKNQRKIVEFAFSKLKEIPKLNKSRHVSVLTTTSGFILTWEYNRERETHPEAVGFFDRRIHAEWLCLKRFRRMYCPEPLSNTFLWNIRINRHNEVCNSKPCEVCQTYLQKENFSPRKVYFSNSEGVFEQWQN